MTQRIILRCGLAVGDIIMLTAAIRDLHRCHARQFITDVRTPFPELWENNPFIAPLSEANPDVQVLDCSYPLIDHCNNLPYHCLHGFIHYLNERLATRIRPTAFKGDIHLSEQERAWFSQVHELTGEATPFWIISAGGKYDVTIKWWAPERYQEVVDHFRGRIQFVQVGGRGHHHPKLDGVIDLRGQTSLRELLRLVYHSQGVLCPVTALMHLAAAVPTRAGHLKQRPCVAIAGGREPAHWEAYPGHQFIHTNGALSCCAHGGCWRDRSVPLLDGDSRDRRKDLCVDVRNGLPRCMDMITPAEVIRRIEMYFGNGVLSFLTPAQSAPAEIGVRATASNRFDNQPLTLQSAGLACNWFIGSIPETRPLFAGRGVVICGGGVKYFTCAWVCINMLRRLGCELPVQLWHLGKNECDSSMRDLVAPLRVECIDASKVRRQFRSRILNGWELKPYAILHCRFQEVLLLDADNVPVRNPEYLFDTPEYRATGAVFWPDYNWTRGETTLPIWRSCGLRQPDEREFETGQILVDKVRCWRALKLTMWFNENSDFYYRYLHGDKETFHLAFRKLRQSYSLVQRPIHELHGTMCQHDFNGTRLFQHRNTDKWTFDGQNMTVRGFRYEPECLQYLRELRRLWEGTVKPPSPRKKGIQGVHMAAGHV